jgi:hypothetical protein
MKTLLNTQNLISPKSVPHGTQPTASKGAEMRCLSLSRRTDRRQTDSVGLRYGKNYSKNYGMQCRSAAVADGARPPASQRDKGHHWGTTTRPPRKHRWWCSGSRAPLMIDGQDAGGRANKSPATQTQATDQKQHKPDPRIQTQTQTDQPQKPQCGGEAPARNPQQKTQQQPPRRRGSMTQERRSKRSQPTQSRCRYGQLKPQRDESDVDAWHCRGWRR